jgi:hypothetical protein
VLTNRQRCAREACRYAQSHWWAGLDISKFANLQAWITRVGDKPAVKAGQSIPGVSVLGKKGPTFAKLATDVELQVCNHPLPLSPRRMLPDCTKPDDDDGGGGATGAAGKVSGGRRAQIFRMEGVERRGECGRRRPHRVRIARALDEDNSGGDHVEPGEADASGWGSGRRAVNERFRGGAP